MNFLCLFWKLFREFFSMKPESRKVPETPEKPECEHQLEPGFFSERCVKCGEYVDE